MAVGVLDGGTDAISQIIGKQGNSEENSLDGSDGFNRLGCQAGSGSVEVGGETWTRSCVEVGSPVGNYGVRGGEGGGGGWSGRA